MKATATAAETSKTSRILPPAAVTCRLLLLLLRSTVLRLCWVQLRKVARIWVV
jgi:hypothetical protein